MIICLDFDGVFNIPHAGSRPAFPLDRQTKLSDFNIRFSSKLAKEIADIISLADVKPFWLTTWAETAQRDLCPLLGFPSFSALAFPQGKHFVWKANAILDLATNNPDETIVWIDDEIQSHFWLPQVKQIVARDKIICLSTDCDVGITQTDITDIKNLLSKNKGK